MWRMWRTVRASRTVRPRPAARPVPDAVRPRPAATHTTLPPGVETPGYSKPTPSGWSTTPYGLGFRVDSRPRIRRPPHRLHGELAGDPGALLAVRSGERLLADLPDVAALIVDEAGAQEGMPRAAEDEIPAVVGADRAVPGIGPGIGDHHDGTAADLVVDHPQLRHQIDRIGLRGAAGRHPVDPGARRLRLSGLFRLLEGRLLRGHPALQVGLEPLRPGRQHHRERLELGAGARERPLHRGAGELLPQRPGLAVHQ